MIRSSVVALILVALALVAQEQPASMPTVDVIGSPYIIGDSGVAIADVKLQIAGPRDLVEAEEFIRGATFYEQMPPAGPRRRAVAAAAETPPKPVLIRRTMCQNNETAVQCPQPKTYRSVNAPAPLDAPVSAGGETARREWVWLKAGEPKLQCTAAQQQDKQWKYSCGAKVGQPFYITRRWRDEIVK